VNGRRRFTRLLAVGLAAVVMGTALGACSSDGNGSTAELAQQDRAVSTANKLEKQNEAKLKAALRIKWQARARARRAAAARQYHRRNAARPTVSVGSARASSGNTGNICAPIRRRFGGRAGRADRNWRRMQRKRVLGYLNLSCPSLNMPRV
jgi:hypothetical protein